MGRSLTGAVDQSQVRQPRRDLIQTLRWGGVDQSDGHPALAGQALAFIHNRRWSRRFSPTGAKRAAAEASRQPPCLAPRQRGCPT